MQSRAKTQSRKEAAREKLKAAIRAGSGIRVFFYGIRPLAIIAACTAVMYAAIALLILLFFIRPCMSALAYSCPVRYRP